MLRLRSPPPLFSSLLLLLLLLALPSSVFAASTIATFYDDACKESYSGFSGPDGFPNGTCTNLNQANGGAFKSFQVVELDPGCAVTIYDNNTSQGPCSPVVLQVADIAHCYNTTWAYYSIDGCTAPSSSSFSFSSPTPSASGRARRRKKKHHTGAIVGGVVGGIAGGAVIASLALFLLRRRRRLRNAQMGSAAAGAGAGPPAELPHDGAVSEMGSGLGAVTGHHARHHRQGADSSRHEMHSPALGCKNAEMEAVVPSEMGGGIEGRTRDEVEQEKVQPVEMEGDVRWMWEGRGGVGAENASGGRDGSVGMHETSDEKDRKRWSWER
ncbi:uncharacterized protein IWZ02DRAFT_141876 [Phyllosticta citriasiana]|uniref:uncharacterized protein n=1 Tax=Phyllosticta citriasiana TaxID=595635 RepID=UPI0030FD4FA1